MLSTRSGGARARPAFNSFGSLDSARLTSRASSSTRRSRRCSLESTPDMRICPFSEWEPVFRMGAPFRRPLGRRPEKPSNYLNLDPEITVVSKNVLWISGWWEYPNGELKKAVVILMSCDGFCFLCFFGLKGARPYALASLVPDQTTIASARDHRKTAEPAPRFFHAHRRSRREQTGGGGV